jgi:hypothetical protein
MTPSADTELPPSDVLPELPRLPSGTVDPDNPEDTAYWVETLGVSHEALVKVIEITGNRAEDVLAYLREQGLPGDSAS